MALQNELLFDLIESEADVNVFFDRENFTVKGAAIIITSNPVGHFPKKHSDKYTVWFGRGIERWTFKSFSQATRKVVDMLQKAAKAKSKIHFRFEGKNKTRFERILAKQMQEA